MQEEASAYRRHPLDVIFSPRNVAVIGASEAEGSIGRALLWNLISHPFGGTIYPVNPQRDNVLGILAYDSIADIPAQVDLAVIATPAQTVPGIIEACIAAGVKGAIIHAAGFREIGDEGRQLEAEIVTQARKVQMRIIGPGSLGVMSPADRDQCDFRPRHGPARQHRLHQRKCRLLQRSAGLEFSGKCRLQRLRLNRRHDRCRLGRLDLLLGRGSSHQRGRRLHGDDPQRRVPFSPRHARSRSKSRSSS